MKRVLAIFIALLAAALCAGCAGVPVQPAASPEAETDTPAETPAPEAETDAPAETPVPEAAHEEAPAAQKTGGGDEARQARVDEEGESAVTKTLKLVIGDTEVAVDWEESESVSALTELVAPGPLTVQMSMYGGFEQVGPLGADLPRDDVQTAAQAGDIVLYSGDQIVVFYGSNSWAYTRLGRITDKSASELADLLGNGGVSMTLSLE